MNYYEYSVVEQIQALITDIVQDTNMVPTMVIIPHGNRKTWLVSSLRPYASQTVDDFLNDAMRKAIDVDCDMFVYITATTLLLKDGKRRIPKSDEEYDMTDPQKYVCLNCYRKKTNTMFISDRIFMSKLIGPRVDVNWIEFDGKTLEQIDVNDNENH